MNIDPSLELTHPEAEAALQALRDALHQSGELPGGEEAEAEEHNRLVEVFRAAGQANVGGLEGGMGRSLEVVEGQSDMEDGDKGQRKRQKTKAEQASEIGQAQELQDSVQTLMTEFMDPSNEAVEHGESSQTFVPREDYEILKARYEALLAQSASRSPSKPAKKRKRARPSVLKEEKSDVKIDGEKRKVRSLKLEHLIHQMANRRLGVIYTIAPYTVSGSRDLPDPSSAAPAPEESSNGVQEYRPDFRADMSNKDVRIFMDVVKDDVRGAWAIAEPADGQELEEDPLSKGVETYWASLCKRFKEQEINNRGEETKQQLGRRKQNQYRRQQSLLARRVAAFDASPLNACRLRSLYRSLLTIVFAPRTEERADPKRTYTQAQWSAYRQLSGDQAAYEVVDHFWLSPAARQALLLLDEAAEYSLSHSKKQGRPKRPSPTFHLPASLWDQSELPVLRPKTDEGLPDPEKAGAIIFRWQVSDSVQRSHPEWFAGLYDDPLIPASDHELPKLEDVLAAPAYRMLRRKVAHARYQTDVVTLSEDDVEHINTHGVPDHLRRAAPDLEDGLEVEQALPDPPVGHFSPPGGEGNTSLESMVNLASDSLPEQSMQIDPRLSLSHLGGEYANLDMDHKAFQVTYLQHLPVAGDDSTSRGKGTSLHARKQRKKGAQSGLPEGAALPVPRSIDAGADVQADTATQLEIAADLDYLQTL